MGLGPSPETRVPNKTIKKQVKRKNNICFLNYDYFYGTHDAPKTRQARCFGHGSEVQISDSSGFWMASENWTTSLVFGHISLKPDTKNLSFLKLNNFGCLVFGL